MRRLIMVVVLLAAAGLGAARARPTAQTTSASTVPHRIVSLVPATTEMLFLMGAADRVAGVSSYDTFPPQVARLPKVGGLIDPNVERLLSLSPDLVIVYNTQTDLKQQLTRAQIPLFDYVHRGLPDIVATMRALGTRVGLRAAAEEAAVGIERELAAIRARVAGRPTPKTLLVFSREQGALRQISASGGIGFLHDVLELAGGVNVLGNLSQQSVTVSPEMVLTNAPDVILELHYGASLRGVDVESERRVWNALPSIPAVKNHRLILLTGDEFVVPGPRIVLAAERMARALHPEAFSR